MSKRRIVQKHLIKGKFYLVHDGSKTGHPGMIYWKNDNKNLYLSLITGTSYKKGLVRLLVPTEEKVKSSVVHKKPFLGKRKDYGNGELKRLKFSKVDKKKILRFISLKEPRYSRSIGRKERRYFNKLKKKKSPKY